MTVSLRSPRQVEMPTGIRDLDKIIYGLHRGHLIVAAARPGGGKTSFACQVAWNLAKQGFTVFYFSLEMSKEEILMRIICNELELSHDLFYSGREITAEVLEKVNTMRHLLQNSKLAIFDDVGYRFDDAAFVTNDFKEKPDVVIVDHVQLVDKRSFRSANDAIEEYARKCKELARTTRSAWILLSQINREAESRSGSPRLENLKGSGALEEIADAVIIGSWDGYTSHEYKLDVAKHRHGKRGLFNVTFQPQFFKFKDAEYTPRPEGTGRRTPAVETRTESRRDVFA